jgi:hypothetical protein
MCYLKVFASKRMKLGTRYSRTDSAALPEIRTKMWFVYDCECVLLDPTATHMASLAVGGVGAFGARAERIDMWDLPPWFSLVCSS